MNKTFIIVRFQYEGFHFWKDAPNEVDFLRKPHRHLFHAEVQLPVIHNDRQLEFFIVKRFLQNFVDSTFDFDLGQKSCEMMCEEILIAVQKKFGLQKGVSVYVSEDGENGSMVES